MDDKRNASTSRNGVLYYCLLIKRGNLSWITSFLYVRSFCFIENRIHLCSITKNYYASITASSFVKPSREFSLT